MIRCFREDRAIVCALLSIWICVIIFKVSDSRSVLEASGPAVSKPVVIVDPGHGGMDGGAVSLTGSSESDVNWDTSVRIRDLLRFVGFQTVMTRDQREILYPQDLHGIAARKKWDTLGRVEFINSFDNAVLISIHQNFYPSPQPRGAQVLYAGNESSRLLGQMLQELIKENLQPDNRRSAELVGKDIYLLNHTDCTAVLLECGFLSNPREAPELETAELQIKTAAAVTAALVRFTGDDNA